VVSVLFVWAASLVGTAFGQTKDSASADTPVVVGGYVDTYFSWNFDKPTTHINQFRNFDVTENSFTVANAEISVTKAPAPVGFRVDADFGPTNDIVQSGATASFANIGQAYVTYVIPVGKGLTVDGGKFVTHMGSEVIKAKDDMNYSRSLQFALAIPYYHLGVRGSYPVSDKLTLNGYVYNSYNGLTVNRGKTFGLEAAVTASDKLSLIGNWIGGPAVPDTISKKFRNVGELIVSYAATEKLSLTADGVYGQDNLGGMAEIWKGVALYVKYATCDNSSLTVRGEVYSDPQGFTTAVPGGVDMWEATVTYEYKPVSNLILRGEYRYDNVTTDNVLLYDGVNGPFTRPNQATLDIAAIVVF
jgi:hypothetical protein